MLSVLATFSYLERLQQKKMSFLSLVQLFSPLSFLPVNQLVELLSFLSVKQLVELVVTLSFKASKRLSRRLVVSLSLLYVM